MNYAELKAKVKDLFETKEMLLDQASDLESTQEEKFDRLIVKARGLLIKLCPFAIKLGYEAYVLIDPLVTAKKWQLMINISNESSDVQDDLSECCDAEITDQTTCTECKQRV